MNVKETFKMSALEIGFKREEWSLGMGKCFLEGIQDAE